jgi:hypothetical protein
MVDAVLVGHGENRVGIARQAGERDDLGKRQGIRRDLLVTAINDDRKVRLAAVEMLILL